MIRKTLVILALAAVASPFDAAANDKPNVLLILADDLGYSDLGCYGSEIQTPNLDRLASEGLRFTQFYNTARCWPTRGALLTGYYAQQIRRDSLPGVPSGGGNRGHRPAWAPLLPRLLKPAGYRSYHSGKWHIDGKPVENGFDHSYWIKDQGRFFNPQRHYRDDQPLPPVPKGTDFYATTALADHAIETLKKHQQDHAEKPFFHYLAFAAPHFPLQAKPKDIEVYRETFSKGWDVVRAQRLQRQNRSGLAGSASVQTASNPEQQLGPPYHFPDALQQLGTSEVNRPKPWRSLTPAQKQFQATKMSIHAAMIHRMDIEIGRVLKQIESMGQKENTLVIFLSDNGASAEIMIRDDGHDPKLPAGSAGTYLCLGPGWSTACNTPFRRHKTWTHEGGISTPLIMSWPKGIHAHGDFRGAQGHVIDVVPTILELAGLPQQNDSEVAPTRPGKSLVRLFQEDNATQHEILWWFHDGHRAIRLGNWKAVSPVGEPWELYNLADDRIESNDLALTHDEQLQRLTSRWKNTFDRFLETAKRDLPAELLAKHQAQSAKRSNMSQAQAAARPKRSQVLLQGTELMVRGRHAFVMTPKEQPEKNKPWIFYAPTLPRYPDKAESWMHERFLAAGVAIAGIDVGEAYGSPHAIKHFDALYDHMVGQGYSRRPAVLGRSRGGLWVSSWANSNPDRIAGIGGIYPVYDYSTYPGFSRASAAYGVTPEQLKEKQDELNPIRLASRLAKAKVPVFIIHGEEDKVVPLDANSGRLQEIYQESNASDLMTLIRVPRQGHNFWRGFFECQPLVDFLIKHAKGR